MKVELSVSLYLWKLRAKVKFSFDRKLSYFPFFCSVSDDLANQTMGCKE